MDCSTPGFPVYHQLLKLAQTHIYRVGDAIQPSHPLLSSSPPAFHLSRHQGLFQWVSSSNQMAKLLELELEHQSFQWIFRTDFLRIDWFDLLALQGILKSLLEHHSSKASIFQHSAFFMVQLSHPHMTPGKTIAEGRSQDSRGVGLGKHFLPHKFIKRAFKRRVNSTKQLLNAGRGHQAPRKATQLFERR